MKNWLTRIRGAVKMGLTWAVAWAGAGIVFGSIAALFGLVHPADLALVPAAYGIAGFLGGGAFSVVLRLAEGRRRFDELSLPRFVAWGAAGGILLFLLTLPVMGIPSGGLLGSLTAGGIFTVLSAGSAAGSLLLARKADDEELPRAGEEALGLIEPNSVPS